MRPLGVLLLLALPALLAGCVDVPAARDDVSPATDTRDGPASAVGEREPVLLGEMRFVLGPQGNTPVSATSVHLEDLQVPEDARRVVLQLEFAEGVTVQFAATGLDGCEQTIGVSQVAGYKRASECDLPPGPHSLKLSHTTGHVTGTARVLAIIG